MLEVMNEIFTEAHSWCFDGADCMLTWPRQLALSRFYTAASLGQKTRAFDPKKEPNTLKTNFGYWKQFLTYTYWVAYRDLKLLRDLFLNATANGAKIWRKKAIKWYKAVANKFLKRLLVLIYMGFGQPLRESELFSVTWRNT
ncbi:hypothetical protein IFR05_005316 [Cadophora sp. M221]|nr:hypothetical protein IFR05_005316 [Cadophora sp. M221]